MAAVSHFVSTSKVGFTEIYRGVMKKTLDNRISLQHIIIGGVPHLELEDLGLVSSLYQI